MIDLTLFINLNLRFVTGLEYGGEILILLYKNDIAKWIGNNAKFEHRCIKDRRRFPVTGFGSY